MRPTAVVFVLLASVTLAENVYAVGSGKTVEFWGGGAGKVIFEGQTHADAGAKCKDCHMKLFKMEKRATKITMADMNAGKNCGACHNGEKAFRSSDEAYCGKCHKKQ